MSQLHKKSFVRMERTFFTTLVESRILYWLLMYIFRFSYLPNTLLRVFKTVVLIVYLVCVCVCVFDTILLSMVNVGLHAREHIVKKI